MLYDKILVRKELYSDTTDGGIVIPETAQKHYNEYFIVATGEGHLHRDTGEITPLKVKQGDKVLLMQYAGEKVRVKSTDFYVIHEKDVLAIIT